MKVRNLVFGLAAVLCVGATANAAIVIPTNQNGADAELRESDMNSEGELNPVVFATAQRGASTELATRAVDRGTTVTNDRSSIMYMKFDISGLPNHVSNAAFWADKNLYFQGTVRNTNLTDGRLTYPNAQSPTVRVNFDIRGLEPGNVYADDDANAANRTDRSGYAYTSANYKYDWAEGNGTVGTGITFIDAPGITPHCLSGDSCADAYGDTDPTNFRKTLGVYDDFNSDSRMLGNWTWPIPKNYLGGPNRYPIGLPLEYTDSNGNLKQLVFDAQDAGRTSVTLMLNLAVDTAGQSIGGTLPDSNSMLNHNYLFNPKEQTLLENDTNWDPDGPGPIGTIGSPYSCLHANCDGDGTPVGDDVLRMRGDNSAGAFSPSLIVRVPEPTSMMLLVLGSLAMGMIRRRK